MKQFLTMSEAAKEFSRSEKTISRMVKKIKEHPERYDDTNFFGTGKKFLIRTACLMDWDRNGELLETAPGICPKYNPQRYEMALGFSEQFPTAKEIASEVALLLKGVK